MTQPAAVLTTTNSVTCGHVPPGRVAFESAAKLRVGGRPVLIAGGGAPQVLPGCVVSVQGDVPCATVVGITAGTATKLRAGGRPVVLTTVAGTTNGVIKGKPGALTLLAAPPSPLVAR